MIQQHLRPVRVLHRHGIVIQQRGIGLGFRIRRDIDRILAEADRCDLALFDHFVESIIRDFLIGLGMDDIPAVTHNEICDHGDHDQDRNGLPEIGCAALMIL